MNKLKEMIKRKKDQGFTLIELMIVIAVIGILAIVLVPKFGNIKTSAKDTGVTTNFRSVTSAIHAVKFSNTDAASEDAVLAKVKAQLTKDFTPASQNALVNPYTKLETISNDITVNGAIIIADATDLSGELPDSSDNSIYDGAIVIEASLIDGIPTLTVYGCDATGAQIDGLKEVIQP